MNELTATYHQNTTGLPEAFRTMETDNPFSPTYEAETSS
jgi:hypothetical protein